MAELSLPRVIEVDQPEAQEHLRTIEDYRADRIVLDALSMVAKLKQTPDTNP
jgi:hypothetical protein